MILFKKNLYNSKYFKFFYFNWLKFLYKLFIVFLITNPFLIYECGLNEKETIKSKIMININGVFNEYGKPVKITSPYGWRFDPFKVYKNKIIHNGIDYQANVGTGLYVNFPGAIVILNENFNFYGNCIILYYQKNYLLFAHLKTIFVKYGQVLNENELIAETGASGKISGPHLHFGVLTLQNSLFVFNKYINPNDFFKKEDIKYVYYNK